MPAKRKRSLNAATEARAVKARAESEEAAPECTVMVRDILGSFGPAGQAPPRDVSPQGLVRSSNLDGSILAALSLVRSLMPGASNTDFASLLVLASLRGSLKLADLGDLALAEEGVNLRRGLERGRLGQYPSHGGGS